MLVTNFASGSKGNSTLLVCGDTKLLIDIGINYKSLKDRMNSIGYDPKGLYGVLITHTHRDHIGGLATLVNKTNLRVFAPPLIAKELYKIINKDNIIVIEDLFHINDIEIKLIPLSHDVPLCVGFIIKYDKKELVYITDTGYINKKHFKELSNKDIYFLESNHDEEMLMNGPYPLILKQRVISDNGHLSNSTASEYLSTWIGDKTKVIILGHLSEVNNTKEVCKDTITKVFKENNIKFKNIILADQYEITGPIEV